MLIVEYRASGAFFGKDSTCLLEDMAAGINVLAILCVGVVTVLGENDDTIDQATPTERNGRLDTTGVPTTATQA